MQRNRCIVITCDMTNFGKQMFSDLSNFQNDSFVSCVLDASDVKSRLIRKLNYKLLYSHLGTKLRRHFSYFINRFWFDKFTVLNEISFLSGYRNFVIITNAAAEIYTPEYLDKLRRKYNLKIVLFLYDTMERILDGVKYGRSYTIMNFKFDQVYTFDEKDAKKYNFNYTQAYYSKGMSESSNKLLYDLYYIGAGKEKRHEFLLSVINTCPYVIKRFLLAGVPRDKQCQKSGINYDVIMPYYKIVNEVNSSNCVLEYVDTGASKTLRYYEAIVYNKKLLTNYPEVKKLEFYNPKYIRYFASVDDIDFDWVVERIDVDYGYNNEFSPINLIEQIIENSKIQFKA